MSLLIRAARPSDEPALRALEGLSPEVGRTTIGMTLRIGHFALAARYPGVRGYFAEYEPNGAIVGALFSSTAPTQLDGDLVPATYLFGARVHPAYRRRGIAPALVEHAWQQAQAAGAHTACAATIDDLPALAAHLNRYYAGHNFYRPQSPADLLASLQAAHHTVSDAVVSLAPNGALFGGATALNVGRIARLRLLHTRSLPPLANRLLSPFYRLLPLSFLLVRHHAFPADQPLVGAALIAALHRHHLPSALTTMVVADPRDSIWPSLNHQWGVSGRIHLVAKGDLPQQRNRPLCLP